MEDLANLPASLADAAIIAFSKHTDIFPSTILVVDTSFLNYAAGAVYLADSFARPARERHNLQHGVVRLMNDKSLFVVSCYPCYTNESYAGFRCSTGYDWQMTC